MELHRSRGNLRTRQGHEILRHSKHYDIVNIQTYKFPSIAGFHNNTQKLLYAFLPAAKPAGLCFANVMLLLDIWLLAYSLRQKLLIASAKNRAIAYSLRQNTIVYSLRRKLLIATAKRKAYLRIVFMLSDVRGCLYFTR